MKDSGITSAKIIVIIVIASFLSLFLVKRLLEPKPFKQSRALMGTVVNITVIERNSEKAQKACQAAFEEISRIEKLMSVKNKSGEIFKLNQNKNSEFSNLAPEIIFILKESSKISCLSRGAFDVTVGPLVKLWKERLKENVVPNPAEIQARLPLVNYRNIEINNRNRVRLKKKGMEINLGGIAKGYAVDRAVKVLKENGIKNCLVEAGGDLFALGKGINRKSWRIGIKHPRNPDLILEFKCRDKGVATSGDYERYKILNDKRYHHLINPCSGKPDSNLVSVTIMASNTLTADALSTAVFILGKEEGIELIREMKAVEGVIVAKEDKKNKIFVSQNLKKLINREKTKKVFKYF